MAASSSKAPGPAPSTRHHAPPGAPAGERSFYASILTVTTACLVVHIVSAQPRFASMWGAHFFAFFPPAVLYAATLLVAAFAIVADRRPQSFARFGDRASTALGARTVPVAIALSVIAGAALFWAFRICHTYLGDGNVIVTEINRRINALLPREPLTSLIQYHLFGLTQPWFDTPGRQVEDVARDAVAVGSVVAGAGFLAALWPLSSELVRLRAPGQAPNDRLLVALTWLCLAAQGYIQLFFGYVENYSFYAVGVVLYLWLCLRCLRGACGLLLPGLALCLCFALHLSSLVLAIPFLVVIVAVLTAPERRRGAVRDLVALAALALSAAFFLARHGANPLAALGNMLHSAFKDPRNEGYTFSTRHYRDFLNEQVLIGPLGMFLFVAALVTLTRARTARRATTATTLFFAIAGSAFAVACWSVGDSNLGYARDWDLLSHSGIVFTVAGLGLFLLRPAKPSTLVACLLIACAVSLYHTVPWIAVNTSEPRSLARLQTLPLGFGRTEVLVAGWYEHRGDHTRASEWLERSIVAFPNNPNSHYMLGMIEMNAYRYDRSLVAFENASKVRPDKANYRVMCVRASFLAAQPARAIPHLQAILRNEPGNVAVMLYLGEALLRMQSTEAARDVFQEVSKGCTEILAQQPNDVVALDTYGWALFRLGDTEKSLRMLTRAVTENPTEQDAHCYLGSVLRSLGRDEEARAQFMLCRDLGDEMSILIPDRDAVIASMASP